MIFLDMDGVICDFVGAALRVHDKKVDVSTLTKYYLEEQLGLSKKEFWRKIDEEGESFWENMDGYPWNEDLFNLLESYGGFCILSAASLNPACLSGKKKWLMKHLGSSFSNFIFCTARNKCLLANERRTLIDDSDTNCIQFWDQGGKAILFPQPWNGNRKLPSYEYVSDKLARRLR